MSLQFQRHIATISVVFAAFTSLSVHALQAPADRWHAVDAGFAAQVLLGRGQTMWAAGSSESVAVSTDGGQHWILKHKDVAGALLLVLHFVDERFGYAAGTGGKVLFTQDGGDTWSVQKVADTSILQAAFGDMQHGVIRTRSALLSTSDGGKNWHALEPANDPDWKKKFPYTDDLAALDKDHMAVHVSEGAFGDGEYLWTSDGGATWSANYIPSAGIHDLIDIHGSYWSFGHEVLGKDKPGGGYAAPMGFHSKDGIEWIHTEMNWEVCHWHGCGGCTPQGCLAGTDAFIAPGIFALPPSSEAKDFLATFAAHDALSYQWARSGATLCLLSQSAVECTHLKAAERIDTQNDSGAWESRSFPPLGVPRPQGPGPECIRCSLTPVFGTKAGDSGAVDIQIKFTLETSGQVDKVRIEGSVPPDVMSELRALTAGWLFEPILEGGKPVAKELGMRGRIMILNPDKPGPGMPIPVPR